MKIIIIRNGVELGPYTAEDINAQLKTGVFSAADVAKYEGSEAVWPLLAVPGIEPLLPVGAARGASVPPQALNGRRTAFYGYAGF